jgi:hypothetical protein
MGSDGGPVVKIDGLTKSGMEAVVVADIGYALRSIP